jgi:alpha-D-xyloside xylohydrolase
MGMKNLEYRTKKTECRIARSRELEPVTGNHGRERQAAIFIILVCVMCGICGCGTYKAGSAGVMAANKERDGVTIKMEHGRLKLQVFSPGVIRVVYGNDEAIAKTKSFAVTGKPASAGWKIVDDANEVRLITNKIEVRVDRASGVVGFYDANGQVILVEKANGERLSKQSFGLSGNEAIYGLGQHPNGLMNYRGASVRLRQENGEIAVPMLVSSRGYGVLWDNASVTNVKVGSAEEANPLLTFSSEAADVADYYFIYGPQLDEVIAGYRMLTGAAPLMSKWTWGFWQCRERYKTQKELLDVVVEYRKRGIGLDGIIQDWQYWKPGQWGSHEFDPRRYPGPTEMVKAVHDANAHIIISVWPKFEPNSKNLAELEKAGAIYSKTYPSVYPKGVNKWYDAFNAKGRLIYWKQISKNLFSRGFDGWWLDASEPELSGKWGEMKNMTTAQGSGAIVYNAWPLLHTTAVYQGQRAETSAKRVFILTRSAYSGQQRNAAVAWSGDIKGTWEVFAKQIPAGLNFSVSGIPYWNTDIGGFFSGNPSDPNYAELFTRWFEFGAFCPMFRVHGTNYPKEIWRFDEATQRIMVEYIRMRYHLIPYIYSCSWMVTSASYTMMRPLVMDFRNDPNVFDIRDQYMFGPAVMVNPVTQPGAMSRNVYLPQGTTWTDFWTGRSFPGGQTVNATATIETMPIFVRAGSIIPYGPAIEYATQSNDPIELRVYRGGDGAFTLYEDEGDNYNYEKGNYATIKITWSQSQQTLTIGPRQGKFTGMRNNRKFNIVWVTPGHGEGIFPADKPDRVVEYSGKELKIR